jgi:hypothetical protein
MGFLSVETLPQTLAAATGNRAIVDERVSNTLPLARGTGRDTRIDFFRGVALIGIAVNHTVPPANVYRTFGHYQFGHLFSFGFADMFVFLSGMVCAMAYMRVLEREGWWGGQKKAIHRCMQIYIANLLAFLTVACIMLAVHAIKAPKVVFLDFDTSKLKNVDTWMRLLWMSPGYNHFNILKFYVVMLLMMPLGLRLYQWKRWPAVLPSLAAYGYIQAAQRLHWPLRAATDGPFGNYLAWQFLFFVGLWIGSEIKRGTLRLNLSPTMIAGLIFFLVGCDYLRQMKFAAHQFSDKTFMGPLRIVELLAVVALVGQLMPRDSRVFQRGVCKWITDLGTRSLEIFALTLVSCYVFTHLAAMLQVGRGGYAAVLLVEVTFLVLVGKVILSLLYGERRPKAVPFQRELSPSVSRRAA